jgi:FlaA1/EpsC-like NDP-sugar epimerase
MVQFFKKHFVRFGPVTVTHPEITRHFMTIPEVSQLMLPAGALIERGRTETTANDGGKGA